MAGATEAAKQLMLVPSNRLYHSTSADTATKIIVGGEMWATDMRYLNDSEEYQLGKRLVVEPLTTALAGVEGWRDAVHLVEDWLDIQQNGTYVASFTEDGDLLSQWLAYCPTGGYAIEFDARRLAEAAESAVRASLEQCVYEPGEQSALAQSFADAAVAELHDQPIPPDTPVGGRHLIRLRRTLAAGITVLLPRIKSVEFRAEREWRLIVRDHHRSDSPSAAGHPPVEFRASSAVVTPFVRVPVRSHGQPLPITGITVAPSPFAELAQSGMIRLLESHGLWDAAENVRCSSIPYRPLPR